MSVIITPNNTLGFNRPLTVVVKRTLTIANHNASPVAFKVKTTAPKLYCVRPNSGRVEPGETVEVSVMLQAMKEEPPLSAKCKDKFLIQSTIVTPEKESLSLQDIWTAEPSEEVHSQKIRVVYLPPEGQTVPEEDEGHADIARLTLLNPPEQFETAPSRPQGNGHVVRPIPDFQQERSLLQPVPEPQVIHFDQPPTPPPQPRAEPVPPPREPSPPVPQPAPPVEEEYPAEDLADQSAYVSVNVHAQSPPTPPPAPAPAPIPVPVPHPDEELIAQLKSANSEIERLRNIISSMPDPSTAPPETVITSAPPPSEFRRRTRAFSDDGSTLSPETEIGSYVDDGIIQPEGVPLQVVIVIALGVFVTTYLFF